MSTSLEKDAALLEDHLNSTTGGRRTTEIDDRESWAAFDRLVAAAREAEGLRTTLRAVIGAAQRYQPNGSPPPGGPIFLVSWILRCLADERDTLRKRVEEAEADVRKDIVLLGVAEARIAELEAQVKGAATGADGELVWLTREEARQQQARIEALRGAAGRFYRDVLDVTQVQEEGDFMSITAFHSAIEESGGALEAALEGGTAEGVNP